MAASTFDEMFTFTRASAATITDIDGTLREVGVDVPRLVEYDAAGAALGLLIEEQRTNLLLWSENFTDGLIWAGSNVTLQGNVAKNIDGSMTADLLSTDTTTSKHRILQDLSGTSGVTYCGSVYAKAGTERFIAVVFPRQNDVFLVDVNTTFDLVTGEYSIGPDAVSAGAVYVGGGFYLCYVTVQAQATATSAFDIRITDSLVNRTGTASGTGAENVILGAAQVEQGSFPTSYIPTAGSQVTRAADNCVRVLGQEFNPDEGTLFVEAYAPDTDVFGFTAIVGTLSNQRISAYFTNGTARAQVRGVVSVTEVTKNVVPGELVKFAIAYNNNTSRNFASVNDVSGVLTNSFLSAGSDLYVGKQSTDSKYLNVPLARIKLYPTALSDAKLITLTSTDEV